MSNKKQHMDKEGISPLIATVLVIGFTIVLAAGVIYWGTGLFKDLQTQTSKSASLQTLCSTGLANLEVTARRSNNDVLVTIDNKNDVDLIGFSARAYGPDGSVIANTANAQQANSIPRFTIAAPVTLTAAPGAVQVGVIPRVDVDGTQGPEQATYCSNEIKTRVV
ncbi:MAG TPA: archaellin/type IV pilin N-terminal domain-containing protein [Candidatus Nanoarchaeia archaeon]|nr:archaellin/type IV pilin N-terminal domain-containing protein [Candidatus Nanoarchaeia archaeon]